MKKAGRVVSVGPGVVSVTIAGNAAPSVADCCTVPSLVVEAKNPLGLECRPGEAVELSDGLGAMVLGIASFLAFPALLGALAASLLSPWWAVLGLILGLFLAAMFFKRLKIDQYPRVVGRVGYEVEEPYEKESL